MAVVRGPPAARILINVFYHFMKYGGAHSAPQRPYLVFGGMGGQERKGREGKKRERRAGQGSGRAPETAHSR